MGIPLPLLMNSTFLGNYYKIKIRGATAPKSQDRLKWLTVQGALWLAKRLSLNLNFSFLNRIRYFSYQVATQLSSRGWVDPVPDPILPEKFLGYSRESNPGPLGWQSDVLTTIPNRWSCWYDLFLKNRKLQEIFGLQIYIYIYIYISF